MLLAAMGGAAPVMAGDGYGPQPEPRSWTGFYVGVNGGAASISTQINDIGVAQALTYAGATNSGTNGTFGGTGTILGGQLGYNWQHGNFIYGVEADLQWSDAKASGSGSIGSTYFGKSRGGPTGFSTELQSLATVRGRFGLDINGNTMLYATAGWASAQLQDNWSATGVTSFWSAPVSRSASNTQWTNGYVLGGGVEYMVSNNWTLKGELDWVKLDDRSLTPIGKISSVGYTGGPANFSNTGIVLGRVGLNYKF